jgi:riboflavin kinase / FMN adenylyltransferase
VRLHGPWDSWKIDGETALTIGVYDGVHRGHQAILERTGGYGATTSVLTFAVHPAAVVSPDHVPVALMTLDDRVRYLELHGADIVAPMPFDAATAAMTPEDFVERIVVGKFHPIAVVVGSDFRFGSQAAGTAQTLTELGAKYGFQVLVVEDIVDAGIPIRSTRIRQLLATGDVDGAANLLGRAFMVEGAVVAGDGRGHTIGFPTANLSGIETTVPGRGVYAVTASIDHDHFHGVANVGVRPTFGGEKETVEVHLFDTDLDLYGRTMRVWFRGHLRDEMKFAGVDELVAQIRVDCDAARQVLAG